MVDSGRQGRGPGTERVRVSSEGIYWVKRYFKKWVSSLGYESGFGRVDLDFLEVEVEVRLGLGAGVELGMNAEVGDLMVMTKCVHNCPIVRSDSTAVGVRTRVPDSCVVMVMV